jgi:hypothetical protein
MDHPRERHLSSLSDVARERNMITYSKNWMSCGLPRAHFRKLQGRLEQRDRAAIDALPNHCRLNTEYLPLRRRSKLWNRRMVMYRSSKMLQESQRNRTLPARALLGLSMAITEERDLFCSIAPQQLQDPQVLMNVTLEGRQELIDAVQRHSGELRSSEKGDLTDAMRTRIRRRQLRLV